MKLSYSTAVGLFKSITGLILVCTTNIITRRTLKMSIF
jgi:ABC-type polysaccharide transport system permease subunit